MAKLTASRGTLLLGTEPLRGHIGFNSFFPFEQAYISSSTTWQTAIDTAASVGAKVLRIPLTPRFPTDLSSFVHTGTAPTWTLRATYISKVNEILNYANTKGISILATCLWRPASAADLNSATVGTIADPASNARSYITQIITQQIANFNSHPALAGWIIFNEVDLSGYTNTVNWGINVPKGTPASYSAPNDVLPLDAVRAMVTQYGNQLTAANAFWITGHAGPQANASGYSWFTNLPALYGSASAVSWHQYLASDGCDRTPESQGVSPSVMMPNNNRPVILDEFGIQISGGADPIFNDPNGDKIKIVYNKLKENGVSLMLEWQLCETADDPIYAIWPGNTRALQRLPTLAVLNAQPGNVFNQRKRPSLPPYELAMNCVGSATSFVTVADAAAIRPATFSVSCWARPTLGTTSGAVRRILSKQASVPPSGWYLGLDPAASNAGYSRQVFFNLQTDNAGTVSNLGTQGATFLPGFNEWRHYCFTWDGTYLRTYVDGVAYGALKTASFPFAQSSASFFIGSDGASLHFVGQLSDVRIYAGAITQEQILSSLDGSAVGTEVGWWRLNGNAVDSVRGNNGSVGAAVTWVEPVTNRTTVSGRSLSPRRSNADAA